MSYMISRCTTNTSFFLSERCRKHVPDKDYSYLLDLPVVSSVTGIIYANIFCAKCYNENAIRTLSASLRCDSEATETAQLVKGMKYSKGNLTWKGSEKECILQLHYDEKDLRWCSKNLINKCSFEWEVKNKTFKMIRDKCLSKTFYIKTNGKYFKNPYCAICNSVNANELECLDSEIKPTTTSLQREFPIKGLLGYSPKCRTNQLWDPINENCETVSCNSFNNSFSSCDGEYKQTLPQYVSVLHSFCKTTVRKSEHNIMYSNGTIYLRKPKLYFKFGEYEFVGDKRIKICLPDGRWTQPMRILSAFLIAISLVCLALHIVIFIALPKRRNIPSMNLFSLTLALFIAELIFECFFHYNRFSILCQVFAALLYYFLSAAFVWMNVMSIDICRTFRSNTYKIKSKKVFIQYSLYAWVVPIFSTSIVILVDNFASKDFYFIPDLGSDRCWFNNQWGHAAFFTIPAGIIVLINMILYGFSVCGIYKQRKLGKLAASSVQQGDKKNTDKNNITKEKETSFFEATSSLDATKTIAITTSSSTTTTTTTTTTATATTAKGKNGSFKGKILIETENFFGDKIRDKIQRKIRMNKRHRVRLALYSKLALIMGMTWIFAFNSIHTKSIILEYMFIIFNGLQGALIFLAFDCKKTVWNDLRERFGWKKWKGFDVSKNEDSRSFTEAGVYIQTEKITFQCTSNNKSQKRTNEHNNIQALTSV